MIVIIIVGIHPGGIPSGLHGRFDLGDVLVTYFVLVAGRHAPEFVGSHST